MPLHSLKIDTLGKRNAGVCWLGRSATCLEARIWLALRCSRTSSSTSLKDLDQAYINFFKDRANSPVFRKKSKKDSFRIPQGFEVDSANGRVKLPKLGWIRYRKSRDMEGKPKNITVSLGNGKIFISIQTEREVNQPLHPSTSVVGLDWGVKRFYTLSDGIYEDGLAPLKEFLPKLRQFQLRSPRASRTSTDWICGI